MTAVYLVHAGMNVQEGGQDISLSSLLPINQLDRFTHLFSSLMTDSTAGSLRLSSRSQKYGSST